MWGMQGECEMRSISLFANVLVHYNYINVSFLAQFQFFFDNSVKFFWITNSVRAISHVHFVTGIILTKGTDNLILISIANTDEEIDMLCHYSTAKRCVYFNINISNHITGERG